MSFLPPSSLGQFAAAYPLSPTIVRHGLMRHPLLSLAALADAASQLPESLVERRIADAANGGDFAMDGSGDSAPCDIIPQIETSGNWIMLRFIEQLPRYRALLDEILAELDPAIVPCTGPSHAMKAFIFISAPGTLTPFHFDAEYNVLFQIAGEKDFATYPSGPPFLSLAQREAYHCAGANMLPWRDGDEAAATVHRLTPGDALYVPYAAPHWVRAGPVASISLSMTWQSEWTQAAGDALTAGPLLRRIGLPDRELPPWPKRPVLRALAGRAVRRLHLL